MLYKKELSKIPLCEIPRVKKSELKGEDYIAGIKIIDVERCGKTLVIDYYSVKDNSLQARFFSDAENYAVYNAIENKWTKNYVSTILFCNGRSDKKTVYSKTRDKEAAGMFINHSKIDSVYIDRVGKYYWECSTYFKGIIAVTDYFIQKKKSEARESANYSAECLFRERQSWFPKPDKSIDRFCNKKSFKENYIFFSTLDKKRKRKCTCSKCGKSWNISENPKHKSFTKCPKCNTNAIWYAERYQTSISDNTEICTAYNHENQLIIRWATVNRRFVNNKPQLNYQDVAYTLYLIINGTTKIVSYFYVNGYMGWSEHWSKAKYGEICYHPAFVYTDNLNETFGEKYYNVDLKKVLENSQHQIDFISLLDNLKGIPQTEYLCKLGLVSLASKIKKCDYNDGKSFEEVMGVSKQYIPLYRKLDITADEHKLISSAKERITEEQFIEFRNLDIGTCFYDKVQKILQYMTLKTLCSYVKKQMLVEGTHNPERIVGWLADYYSICENLDIKIDKKTVRPQKIKESHDILVARYNKVKSEIEDAKSKAALELVNNWFKGYEKNGYCIVVPRYKSDFIKEGQVLHHCVGNGIYYNKHIKGESMIFFVRKADEPDTPYITAEIDMINFKVLQCYGFGDKEPKPEVKKFVNEFCRYIKTQIKSSKRKAG